MSNYLEQTSFYLSQGYTGEDGFEIYCNIDDTEKIWDGLLEYNVMPCGLGARDTLD